MSSSFLTSKLWHFTWRELRNSLLATLALGLALGSALASSLAASEGNIGVATGLAVFSLLLAFVIAVTVLPRLFRRARREWLWLPFSVTREGWIYLVTVLVVAAAAFNTGNNLIFIILSAALALGAVSELLSALNLLQLDCTVDSPPCVEVRQRFVFAINLHNRKPCLPAFSWTAEDQFHSVAPDSAMLPMAPASSNQAAWSTPMSSAASWSVYVPFLGGNSQRRQIVSLSLPYRGLYKLDNIGISSRFPFGFVSKTKRARAACEIIALPEDGPLNELFEILPQLSGAFESFYKGRGSDLHSLRDYATHDSARLLDWKASAKTGQLMVREFLKEEDRKCCFVFDNLFSDFKEEDRLVFERAVKVCASALRHFYRLGCEMRLATPQASTRYSKSGDGLIQCLKLLALIQPAEGVSGIFLTLIQDNAFKVIFTADRKDDMASTWNSAHIVFFRDWSV
jgi:uncharacterized protein (DUF58 family)